MAQAGSYAVRGLIGVAAIVLVGVILAQSTTGETSSQSAGRTIDASAYLSGQQIRNVSTTFDGGKVTAFMGGVKLDLQDAIMDGDEAVLDVTAVMGGVELWIPDDWTVVSEVDAVLGGVDNRTRAVPREEGAKTLTLRGTVLMGGLQIRN